MLQGKHIVLGVTGGIAAYKAVELASRLTQLGSHVHVIMTKAATKLVAPLTFQAITGQPVEVELLEEPKRWSVEHVSLNQVADLMVVAPATYNLMGKVASGIADDFLTTVLAGAVCPVLLCPAMEPHMYASPIFVQNVERLRGAGLRVMEAEEGRMASGLLGRGRLPEPIKIVGEIYQILTGSVPPAIAEAMALADQLKAAVQHQVQAERQPKVADLAGRRFLITAGPTQEPLDPVRYLTNRSSGKMGYAIAAAAARRGAEVVLLSGPSQLRPPHGVQLIRVQTAAELLAAAQAELPKADVIIGTAAVADYRPASYSPQKLKKGAGAASLELVQNPDVLATLAKQRRADQLIIGFAAETERLVEHAQAKLRKKQLDLIVANDISAEGSGFEVETNEVTLITPEGSTPLPLLSKAEVAERLLNWVAERR